LFEVPQPITRTEPLDKRTFLLGAAIAAVGAPGSTRADLPHLRYGGDAAFPPFELLDAQGQPRGFQIDLLAELGPAAGIVFDITLKPWKETEAAFRSGQFDVVAMIDAEPRRAWARFTHGHATPAMGVYQPQGRPEPQGMHDLAGLRVAVLDSEAMRDTLATVLAGVRGTFVPLPTVDRALAAVRAGDVDVALLPRAYADPVLRADASGGLRASHLSLALQSYAFAVPPDRPDLQAQLQRGLDALESDGRLEALRVRWLSSHHDVAERTQLERGLSRQRDWTWGIAGLSAAALLAMAAGLRRRSRRIAKERQRREAAELALRHAEGLLERSFAHHPDPMLFVEHGSGVVRDANAAMLALLGVDPDALIGTDLQRLDRHVDAAMLAQLVTSLETEGALDAVPLRLHRADGDARDCLVSADRFAIGAVPHVFCIVRDITDQLAADRTLRAGYDALAAQLEQSRTEIVAAHADRIRAEGALEEFTRAVAHDLKTPLNAVQGFAGLLRRRLQSGHVEEAFGYTDRIDRAARRMTVMINALSSLSQVTRQPLRREPVDMQRVAEETWALISAAHPARTTEFRIESLPMVDADPELVVQVWQNLLDNASKYSARVARPAVRVDSHRDARGIWFRVTDNGDGFDMSQATMLFQPFQRMHAASRFEGTGVGLSLVRRIVDHHGGDVRLRSAPGVGTVAEFTLDPPPPE
jgi:PAS domain S-box-containing protein